MAKQIQVGQSFTITSEDRAPDKWTTEGGNLSIVPNGHSCEVTGESVTPEGEPDIVLAAGVPVLRVNVVPAPRPAPVQEENGQSEQS